MTGHIDHDRILEAWLADGPTTMSNDALTAMLRALDAAPERGWLARRRTGQLQRALAFAATGMTLVLVIAVTAWAYLNSRPATPLGGSSPSPTTVQPASPSPSATIPALPSVPGARTPLGLMFRTGVLESSDEVILIEAISEFIGIEPVVSARIWNLTDGSIGEGSSLGEPDTNGSFTALGDGRVLAVGGYDGPWALGPWAHQSAASSSAQILDARTGESEETGSLAEARTGHTSTRLPDGRVLVIGGMTDDGNLAAAEVWDPNTGAFTPAGALHEGRWQHSATLLDDGRVLVVGGLTRFTSTNTLSSAELWEPDTRTFVSTGALLAPRFGHTATLTADGSLLVIGGSTQIDGTGALATVEVWDPIGQAFRSAGELASRRMNHSATLLSDGRLLVLGGQNGANPTRQYASGELFTFDGCPSAQCQPGTASAAPGLSAQRTGHTALQVEFAGRALIVVIGGVAPREQSLELYEVPE